MTVRFDTNFDCYPLFGMCIVDENNDVIDDSEDENEYR